ncbi:MAG TPA: DNA primase [Rhodanobacteraceae bacterium]|nr:DNA primase [Rhodanobacteraceae bacterium]
MVGRIPDSFITDLLTRVDIVDVVQERVALKKSGRDFSARCPFHDERSPSFTVSPAKQFYHCFGCGAHGSAIKFLMEYDRLEFPDAIEELAARAGLKVPREGGSPQAPREDTTELYALLDAAAAFYRRELENNGRAGAYLAERGLDAATLARFNVGYAPDQWDALKNALGTDAARIALLEKAGMLTSGERGTKYDRFRDRVMFPIRDRRGRTIAFGGRVLPAGDGVGGPERGLSAHPAREDQPKYLNSPETPLFHKGRELFGLAEVRAAHAKIPRLIVVEGYMDVIALHQFGATGAVATLGTATTRDHAEILFRQCADVYFCFDGDRAGRQAAWRAVESVLPRMRDGRQASFVFLPEGEDPDSVIRKEGPAGFEQRLKDAIPLSAFFFAEIGKDVNLASLDGKARLAERARPLIAEIPDGAFRDLMLAELDRRSGISIQLATSGTGSMARAPITRAPPRSLVRTAVALLVQRPGLANALQPPWLFAELRQPGVPLLIELIEFCRSRPDLNAVALLEHHAGREEAGALAKLAVMDFPGGEDEWRIEFVDAIAQLDRQTIQQRLDDLLKKKTATPLSETETAELRELLASKGRQRG